MLEPRAIRILGAALWVAVVLEGGAHGELRRPFTIEVQVGGRRLEGWPLKWSPQRVQLLGRDGTLWQFAPDDATEFRKTADGFQSLAQSEVRSQLVREFGRRFEVSGTGHYLVVHPAGQRDRWAGRFESLYRSFQHYFTARGLNLASPRFPLVAIVFPDEPSFRRYAARDDRPLTAGTLGYYARRTNRILLYDVTRSEAFGEADWRVNADTILHEAAHQMAFNTGIHSRYTVPPRWVAEGLGTLFEAPGVWDSRHHPRFEDRLNRERLRAFQAYLAHRPTGRLATFVASDRPFSANARDAYAEAWALTFFLVETRPREYLAYLKQTAELPPFTVYASPRRLADFTAAFGPDLPMLEAHFLRYWRQRLPGTARGG